MARIRSIKHEFFYSEQVASCSAYARLFFIGLWTLADREGRLKWSARKLKTQVFPYSGDPDHPDHAVQVHALAEELTAAGLMHVYELDGATYAWIAGFKKHQRPHPKEPASTVPACPDGHDPMQIPWNRTVEPCKETASRVLPGDIPSSPALMGSGLMGSGSLGSGSLDDGYGEPTPPPAPRSSSSSPLVMSPLRFERLKESHSFVGARLRVPNVLHEELRTKLGGENPEARLMAWYGDLDAELERSKEPIPDVFTWLRPKFLEFVGVSASPKPVQTRHASDPYGQVAKTAERDRLLAAGVPRAEANRRAGF